MDPSDDEIDILYIEDDEVDIQNMQREFKKVNNLVNVAIARDGVDALNKLYGRNGEKKLDPLPKVIIADLNMPKMNGMEFIKTLRLDPELNSIRIYLLTVSCNTETKLIMSALNITGCIVKPLLYEDALNIYWRLFHK